MYVLIAVIDFVLKELTLFLNPTLSHNLEYYVTVDCTPALKKTINDLQPLISHVSKFTIKPCPYINIRGVEVGGGGANGNIYVSGLIINLMANLHRQTLCGLLFLWIRILDSLSMEI